MSPVPLREPFRAVLLFTYGTSLTTTLARSEFQSPGNSPFLFCLSMLLFRSRSPRHPFTPVWFDPIPSGFSLASVSVRKPFLDRLNPSSRLGLARDGHFGSPGGLTKCAEPAAYGCNAGARGRGSRYRLTKVNSSKQADGRQASTILMLVQIRLCTFVL